MINKITLDDTLSAELDALGETYWRWAVREDELAGICNHLYRALRATLTALAPEGTKGDDFAEWTLTAFSDNRPDKSLVQCIAMALTDQWRANWDATWITCDYCTVRATRVTDSDEPLCDAHAKEHYGADWRTETRILGVRATARLQER
jgi:hypothetical protein